MIRWATVWMAALLILSASTRGQQACCFPNGNCNFQPSSTACTSAGGVAVTTCGVCEAPYHCCFASGTCVVLGHASCYAAQGIPVPFPTNYGGSCADCGPYGACCYGNGTCATGFYTNCVLPGVLYPAGSSPPIWIANGTCGSAGACVPGACCAGVVCTMTIAASCTAAWQGAGQTCAPANPCAGACCVGLTCVLMSSVWDCGIASGSWQGWSVTCGANSCLSQGGACCYSDGTCSFNTSGLLCEAALGGDWQGLGTVCSPVSACPPGGACCSAANCLIRTAAACSGSQTWLGAGTTCQPNLCQGACCLVSGVCALEARATCAAAFFHAGIVCQNVSCPPAGACCEDLYGGCTMVTQGACSGAFQTWRGVESVCTPNPCPQPSGACCAGPVCTFTQNTPCAGSWQGPYSSCYPSPCGGVCCQSTGACQPTSLAACTGTWLGAGTTCSPNLCTGVCCSSAGGCSVRTRFTPCPGGSTFVDWGTTCNPSPCFAACCTAGGACSLLNPAACSGQFLGFATTCTPANRCAGVCCSLMSPACMLVPGSGSCSVAGWQGSGSTCSPNPCWGACCAATACSLTHRDDCISGDWLGSGMTCGAACGGACCTTGGACVVSPRVACEATVGQTWLGSGSVCAPGACLGACCLYGSCAVAAFSAQCAAPRTWQGVGTTCTPNDCIGACCLTSGGCVLMADGNQCIGSGGTSFAGTGSTCSPNTCPQPGACCLGSSCGVGQQLACPGVFVGGGTACGPANPCVGACCHGPACAVATPLACTGMFKGGGTACGPGVCCRADFNYSQTLDVQDIFAFLTAWFGNQPSADFNGVGGISVLDIFAFLTAWFAGCS